MPQDERKATRTGGTRKISKLAKRDFADLELVRRRLNDAIVGAGTQEGMFIVLDPWAAAGALEKIQRILNECDLHREW